MNLLNFSSFFHAKHIAFVLIMLVAGACSKDKEVELPTEIAYTNQFMVQNDAYQINVVHLQINHRKNQIRLGLGDNNPFFPTGAETISDVAFTVEGINLTAGTKAELKDFISYQVLVNASIKALQIYNGDYIFWSPEEDKRASSIQLNISEINTVKKNIKLDFTIKKNDDVVVKGNYSGEYKTTELN